MQGIYSRARQQGIQVVIEMSGSRSSSPSSLDITIFSGRSKSRKRKVAVSDVVSFLQEECHASV